MSSRLLLHICCAPCALVPLDVLAQEGWDVSALFYNPNIHPADEYRRRYDTFASYAASCGVPLVQAHEESEAWERLVAPFGGPYPLIQGDANFLTNQAARQQRCSACYQLRFTTLAACACDAGYEYIATTLTISPYQFFQTVNDQLAQAATQANVSALQSDFRSFYPEATNRSRALGLYRQNYCGCRFSQAEAQIERDARKAARKRANAAC